MAEQTVLVAIDIGTTKVCVLIGEMADRGGVDVIGIGQAASDGGCIWRNEGPYPLKPEAGIPASAAIPGKAYGDLITPISNFLRTSLCNPQSSTPPARCRGIR